MLHCDSVVGGGFFLGFAEGPQISRWLLCGNPHRKGSFKKNILGPIRSGPFFLAVPLCAYPIPAAFCESEVRYALGLGIFCVFLTGLLMGWKRERDKGE